MLCCSHSRMRGSRQLFLLCSEMAATSCGCISDKMQISSRATPVVGTGVGAGRGQAGAAQGRACKIAQSTRSLVVCLTWRDLCPGGSILAAAPTPYTHTHTHTDLCVSPNRKCWESSCLTLHLSPLHTRHLLFGAMPLYTCAS